MKQKFINKNFRHASLVLIEKCQEILEDYNAQGYDMTLRQLYYQLVRRNEIENKKESYDNLGSLVNDARLAGYIDWSFLVDRTRNLKGINTYETIQERLSNLPYLYALDKWSDQKYRIEVWIEKEALEGVFARACNKLQVDYFACRGYTSASEMYVAAQRLLKYKDDGQTPIILHHGDHDPSGIDMTRDILDRLQLFTGGIEVRRMALNMAQIEQYDPPANFAKVHDKRFKAYQQQYGDESWELDALEPETLNKLVTDTVLQYRDETKWQAKVEQEKYDIGKLHQISDKYEAIRVFLDETFDNPKDDEDGEPCINKGCKNIRLSDGSYCKECKDLHYCLEDDCYNKAPDGKDYCTTQHDSMNDEDY
jgi:hypothetical protein